MTTSRKIFIALLIVAIGALVWDKSSPHGGLTSPDAAAGIESAPPTGSLEDPLAEFDEISDLLIDNSGNGNLPVDTEKKLLAQSGNSSCKNILGGFLEKGRSLLSNTNTPAESKNHPRDLFSPSENFVEAARIAGGLDPKEQIEIIPPTPPVLKGIFIGTNQCYVLLDNEILSVGDNIGPFVVKKINPDNVVLHAEKTKISLFLD
ncbi:MAG: hypothetical protein JXD22_14150 [Sedimentisphaerales bacterium]|nr:hypothetical protein [Sedimentisphaerales bacterium]